MNDLAASPEFGGDVRREHLGVRTRNVNDDIRGVQQTIENVKKRHVCAFAVGWVDLRKINALGKGLLHELNFVDQDICALASFVNSLVEIGTQGNGIAKVLELVFFEVDFKNALLRHSRTQQVILEEREEKIAFPASADAGDNFDQMVIFGFDQTVQKGFALDLHDGIRVLFVAYVNVN